ncbi:MAG: hypothetical protein ACFCD0_10530 [Gemmataceae bacterium]
METDNKQELRIEANANDWRSNVQQGQRVQKCLARNTMAVTPRNKYGT